MKRKKAERAKTQEKSDLGKWHEERKCPNPKKVMFSGWQWQMLG